MSGSNGSNATNGATALMCDACGGSGWGVHYLQGAKKDITEEVYEQGFEGQVGVYQAENQENAF